MLAMDKTYLTRENESLEARLAAAAQERDAAVAQLRDVKQRHDAVCEKLLEVGVTMCRELPRDSERCCARQAR